MKPALLLLLPGAPAEGWPQGVSRRLYVCVCVVKETTAIAETEAEAEEAAAAHTN